MGILQIALLNLVVYYLLMHYTSGAPAPENPTLGFTELPLNLSNFQNHHPYDLPVSELYSFADGIHKLWVYGTDKPMSQNKTTNPQSEIRIRGYDYASGIWQFEGQGYVPNGTSGLNIMQVLGGDPPNPTTLMVHIHNSSLTYYKHSVLVRNIWDRWFQLNVIHNVEAFNVKIYVDGNLVLEGHGQGGSNHYFKFGVYAQDDASNYMESRWRGIRVLNKTSYLPSGLVFGV